MNRPTIDEVVSLYGKHQTYWAEEEYLGHAFGGELRACTSGICLVEKVGPDEALRLVDVEHGDIDEIVRDQLGWSDAFLNGVVFGNDGQMWSYVQHRAEYRNGTPEVQADLRAGWELGAGVRDRFYDEPEEPYYDDED